MTDENDSGKKKGDGAAVTYVQTVNGYAGPDITLLASDLKAYTTTQSDSKFGQIASKTQRGQVIVGAGLTVDAQGVIGTNSSAPDWSAITNKPTEYPPTKAGTTVLGGVKVGAGLQITPDGTLYSSTAAPDWANITNKPAAYPPTIASATQVGGVKQGSGILIDPATGTINATGSKPTWDSIEDKPTEFPPPVASPTVLGGVKEGNNIEIGADGTISSYAEWDEILHKPAEFPPTVASASVRGGVYVGSGLEANESGVLSLSLAHPNEIGGIIPGITLATDEQSGRIDVVPASKDNFGAVKIGDTLYIDEVGDLQANPGAIQPATDTVLGGVKIGTGVNVTEEGVISVPQGFPFPKNHLNFSPPRGADSGDGIFTWEVPDNCEVFRVTVIGSGGSGAFAKKTGGTGGGGAGWAQSTFFGVPKGTKFKITAGKQTYGGRGPDYSHASLFQTENGSRTYLTGNGGQNGFDGVDDTAKVLVGARGGKGVHDYDAAFMTIPFLGTGGDGGWAACINSKPYGGLGGSSAYSGMSWYSGQIGGGGGGAGVNTADGTGTQSAAGQDGMVIIEW